MISNKISIFGDYNPGGKLSVTFPKTIGQVEFNFPYKLGSHNSQGEEGPNGFGKTQVNGALYPFGYGLSYTTFSYSDLKVTPTKLNSQAEINVLVNVTNTGKRAGDEVVQLYTSDKTASVVTYDFVLRGFERVPLQAGETKTVHFTLQPSDLMLLDKNMKWTVESGDFEIKVEASSEDIRLKQTITIFT
jgi:beta-glucosidase|tara:strand:+ start:5058 stop:5624 length:567 start_codon:yes stop_codon:yes gene_type:complete